MGIYIDDDQVGCSAGNPHTKVGVCAPPLFDPILVEGRSVETVTPSSGTETQAVGCRVGRRTALRAVARWGLPPSSERMHRPPAARTPTSYSHRKCSA